MFYIFFKDKYNLGPMTWWPDDFEFSPLLCLYLIRFKIKRRHNRYSIKQYNNKYLRTFLYSWWKIKVFLQEHICERNILIIVYFEMIFKVWKLKNNWTLPVLKKNQYDWDGFKKSYYFIFLYYVVNFDLNFMIITI